MRLLSPLLAIASILVALDARSEATAIILRWEAIPGAASYELEVAADKAFTQVIAREKIPDNRYRWLPAEEGRWFWRVRAIDVEGREGEFSKLGIAGTPVPAPSLVAPENDSKIPNARKTKIQLRWNGKSDFVESFEIEIARNSTFTKKLTRLTATEPEITFRADKPGNYFWRVGAVDAAGNKIPPGAFRRFTVAGEKAVAVPIAATFPRETHAGARVGVFSSVRRLNDPGDLIVPRIGVEAGLRFAQSLSVSVATGYYQAAAKARGPGTTPDARSTLQAVPIEVDLLYRRPLLGGGLYAGGGPMLTFVSTRVTTPTQPALTSSSTQFGATSVAGWERNLGPGRGFLEAGLSWSTPVRGYVEMTPGGLFMNVGYRVRIR